MLLAKGIDLGARTKKFLDDRDLTVFIQEAKSLLEKWESSFLIPGDLAFESEGERAETEVSAFAFPSGLQEKLFFDIGKKTIQQYCEVISHSGTVFVNGPAGVYEDIRWEQGTRKIWEAISKAPGYTVIGGGDSVNAAAKFTGLDNFSYVCTAGGAMVRFLSGKKLPLVMAMEKAYDRNLSVPIR
jgi:phosphoglycerate kinase